MIILQHLTVEHVGCLRRVDLHFPQRGSILISGPNESGKSALLESIYFALYGESLSLARGGTHTMVGLHEPSVLEGRGGLSGGEVESERWKDLDGLVHYGETQASVTLTLSIGVTELTITRTIERGRGQSVRLSIHRLGLPEEMPITRVSEANERIVAELGGLDGEALRDSCLIEQGGASRLEYLDGSRREASLRKLLGLEQLVRVSEQFELTERDSELLDECRLWLKLAEVQARIPELSMQLGQIEAALDAVAVTENLAEIDARDAEIAEEEVLLEQLALQRNEFKGRQNRIAQLKKAETILGEIIEAYDTIAEAQRELPELERQIAELERRERDELPALENRVHDLSELTRSFGTLERLAADLLAAVNTIKALEQARKEQEDIQDDLSVLDEQIIAARLQVEQVRQSQHEVEERDRAARPQLGATLRRLQALAERVEQLSEVEERYTYRLLQQGVAEENSAALKKVQQELQETETELELVEKEATQLKREADAIEDHWRQVSIGRQLEEWRRFKGLSQGLADAEQHVMAAHQQQEQLTLLTLAARRTVTKNMGMAIACITLFVLCGSAALLFALHSTYVYATIAGLGSLLLAAGAGLALQNYGKAREEERVADAQMQEAISRVGMMVAAREAASRVAGGAASFLSGDRLGRSSRGHDESAPTDEGQPHPYDEALAHIEYELRSLGGTIPRSLDEAEGLLQQIAADQSALGAMNRPLQESLADMQQRMTESRNSALAARNQVNVTMEAVAVLRKERTRLEGQRKSEGWDNLSEQLLSDAAAIEELHHEITSSAGQEGLPILPFEPASDAPASSNSIPVEVEGIETREASDASRPTPMYRPSAHVLAQFKTQLEDAIRSTEREIAALDGKLDLLPELKAQVDVHQASLDVLLARRQSLEARMIGRKDAGQGQGDLLEQLERAHQQQVSLRDGLRSLQDSLRVRVQKLGVSFGQAAISTAEAAARQQLESLHIVLGQRVELENRHATYAGLLRDRQERLSEHYSQLSKLSGTLGSWIVPPSPFAEDLAALRVRCQQEVREADEEATRQQLAALNVQEGASQAKIALCREEIEAAQERIATLLAQRNRPPAKGYSRGDIVAVWPLVGEYSPQDRERLRAEAAAIEQELHELEEQERTLSKEADQSAVATIHRALQGGTARIDLEQARKRLEQQERVYETKKRGSLLVQAVQDRLMQKMLPRTEYYMQQLLPALTLGRFHDARLTPVTHPCEGAWQISVWEPQALAYIPRSALSGATADQLSLALRLAFAIAALPRELNMAPGFLLLDDPLSVLDPERVRALVELVTGRLLSSHFEQILLVTHSGASNPGQFAYYITINDGEVVESNLPVIPVADEESVREAVVEEWIAR